MLRDEAERAALQALAEAAKQNTILGRYRKTRLEGTTNPGMVAAAELDALLKQRAAFRMLNECLPLLIGEPTIDRDVLVAAKLATHVFIDTDGYRSTAIHSNEEAADRVLALLQPREEPQDAA